MQHQTRRWLTVVLFVSSYAPLGVILVIRDYFSEPLGFKHPWTVATITVVVLLSAFLLAVTMQHIEGEAQVRVLAVSNRSNDLINYTIPYIVSFFAFDLGRIGDLLSLLFFLALLCILTVQTQSVFVHPLLGAAGYGMYEMEYEEDGKRKTGYALSRSRPDAGQFYVIRKVAAEHSIITSRVY